MTDLKNNLEEALEVNPMNNKKYIEAVSFMDWQTCDLICDEHSVLVGRIKHLEQELQKTREQLNEAFTHIHQMLNDDCLFIHKKASDFLQKNYLKDKQGE